MGRDDGVDGGDDSRRWACLSQLLQGAKTRVVIQHVLDWLPCHLLLPHWLLIHHLQSMIPGTPAACCCLEYFIVHVEHWCIFAQLLYPPSKSMRSASMSGDSGYQCVVATFLFESVCYASCNEQAVFDPSKSVTSIDLTLCMVDDPIFWSGRGLQTVIRLYAPTRVLPRGSSPTMSVLEMHDFDSISLCTGLVPTKCPPKIHRSLWPIARTL